MAVMALGMGMAAASAPAHAYSCGLMEDRCDGGMQWFCQLYEQAVALGEC